MSLTTRWTLVLAAVSTVLLSTVAVLVEMTLRGRERSERDAWRQSREEAVELRLIRSGNTILASFDGFLQSADRQELELQIRQLESSPTALQSWGRLHAPRYSADQLLVLDSAGRVTTSALWPERVGSPHPAADHLQSALSRTPVLWRGWMPEGEAWVLGGADVLQVGSERFQILLGRVIDDDALAALAEAANVDSVHWSRQPRSIGSPLDWQIPTDIGFQIQLSDPPAAAALSALRLRLMAIGLLGLGVAFVLAPWLVQGLGGAMGKLASAVTALGQGDRVLRDLPRRGPTEVRQLAGAIGTLAHDLDAAEQRMRAAERRAAWRDIAQRIAHEIKNALSPLTLAVDNVETAATRPDAAAREALTSSLATAREQLESLDRLVTEFRSFARVPRLRVDALQPATVCARALEAARPVFPQTRFVLVSPPQSQTEDLRGDAEQLRRALYNLLVNAAEAAPDDVVELGFGWTDGGWWMRVSDRGPGLAPEVASRLGEPYLTTKTRGTGLGLAIVLQIVEAHGGRLEAQPRPGGGTEMTMTFPLRLPNVPPASVLDGLNGIDSSRKS